MLFLQDYLQAFSLFVISDDINKDESYHVYEWLFHSEFPSTGTNPVTINGYDGKFLKIWYTAQGLPDFSTNQKILCNGSRH